MLHCTPSTSIGEAHRRWKHDALLTEEMQGLMSAVATALDAGIFYDKDLYQAITAQFDWTREELERNSTNGAKVENGVVGMDIYYARGRIETKRAAQAETEARARLAITEGQKLGTLKFPGYARMRNCTVGSLGPDTLVITVTRGNKRSTIRTTARAIEQALLAGTQ